MGICDSLQRRRESQATVPECEDAMREAKDGKGRKRVCNKFGGGRGKAAHRNFTMDRGRQVERVPRVQYVDCFSLGCLFILLLIY